MKEKAYIKASGILFAIISLLHLLRALFQWPAQIMGYHLPIWFSLVAFLAAGSMSIWAFSFIKK